MLSSWSEAARWKTEKIFFQPDRMFAAWEFTIWAMQRTTMSLMVGDLEKRQGRANRKEDGDRWRPRFEEGEREGIKEERQRMGEGE